MGQLHLFTSYPKDSQRYSVEEHILGNSIIAIEKFRESYKFELGAGQEPIFAEKVAVTIDNLDGQYLNVGQTENCIPLAAIIKTHGLAVSADGKGYALVISWLARPFMSRHSDVFTLFHEIGHLNHPESESDPEWVADSFAVKKIAELKRLGFDLGFDKPMLAELCFSGFGDFSDFD